MIFFWWGLTLLITFLSFQPIGANVWYVLLECNLCASSGFFFWILTFQAFSQVPLENLFFKTLKSI